MTHQHVSDDVSANGVNRVNRARGGVARPSDDIVHTSKVGTHVWSNLGALKALLSRAERELSREPGGYVAVAVVGRDKREEQVGRWEWVGSQDAAGRVGQHGGGLANDARGLRVRVHREGGDAVGSALLRRAAAAVREREQPEPAPASYRPPAVESERFAMMEAQLAWVLTRSAAQDQEIALLKATIAAMGPVAQQIGNFHKRLDALEAAAHRHPEDAEEPDTDQGEVDDDEEEYEPDEEESEE